MDQLNYARATSVPHALALLGEPGYRSRVLAGGTDLMVMRREDPKICDRVVDISLIPDLHEIVREDDRVTIGAACCFNEVIESPVVNATAPLLVQACRTVGATQIRNMGTLGGNVANAAACADSLPALICLDAVATVASPEGRREWAVSDLVTGPNRTQLPRGSVMVSLSYPVPAEGSTGIFLKLGRRNAMAISRLTVAALGRQSSDGTVVEARLVPGSATPHIHRFGSVEALLLGRKPDVALCEAAGRAAVAEMVRLSGRRWSSEFKEPAVLAMTTRALLMVFGLPWGTELGDE